MEDLPLPNTGDGQDGSGQDKDVYVIRLTPFERYILQEVIDEVLSPNEIILTWFISREELPVEHFHIVIRCVPKTGKGIVRELFKEFVYRFWPTRPRGFGNAQYNFQESNDESRAIQYAIKDKGEYYYDGYLDEYIKERLEASFQKIKTLKTFKDDYYELCEKYQTTKMSDQDFMTKFMQLKAEHGQGVSVRASYEYLLSNKIKKDPSQASYLAAQFLKNN